MALPSQQKANVTSVTGGPVRIIHWLAIVGLLTLILIGVFVGIEIGVQLVMAGVINI